MRCHTQMLPSTVPWALALLCRHESEPDVNVVATVVLVLVKDPDQWQAVQRHPSSQEQAVSYEAEIPGTDHHHSASLPCRMGDGHTGHLVLEWVKPPGGVQGQGIWNLVQSLGAAGAFSEGQEMLQRGHLTTAKRCIGGALCIPTISNHSSDLLDLVPSVPLHCCLLSPGPHCLLRGWPQQPPSRLLLEHSRSPSIHSQS